MRKALPLLYMLALLLALAPVAGAQGVAILSPGEGETLAAISPQGETPLVEFIWDISGLNLVYPFRVVDTRDGSLVYNVAMIRDGESGEHRQQCALDAFESGVRYLLRVGDGESAGEVGFYVDNPARVAQGTPRPQPTQPALTALERLTHGLTPPADWKAPMEDWNAYMAARVRLQEAPMTGITSARLAIDGEGQTAIVTVTVDETAMDRLPALKRAAKNFVVNVGNVYGYMNEMGLASEDMSYYGEILDSYDVRIVMSLEADADRPDAWLMDMVVPAGTHAATRLMFREAIEALLPQTLGIITAATDGGSVRSGPGTEHGRIARVRKGQTCDVVEISENGWYAFMLPDGQMGFISPSMVTFTQP